MNFEIALNDKISSPAKAAALALKGAASEAKQLEKDIARLSKEAQREEAEQTKAVAREAKRRDDIRTQSAKYAGQLAARQAKEEAAAAKSVSDEQERLTRHMGSLLAGAGAAAFAAAAVGVGLLTTAIAEGADTALHASEDYSKLKTQLGSLSEGHAGGASIVADLDKVGASIGKTREELAPLARAFEGMGIQDLDKLNTALKASASSEALVGSEGAAAFENLTRKIQTAIETGQHLKIATGRQGTLSKLGLTEGDIAGQMGISAKTLGAQLKAGTEDVQAFGDAIQAALIQKGAPAVEEASKSFSATTAKFRSDATHLFEDVDTKPFVGALRSITDEFDKNSVVGGQMSEILSGIFGQLGLEASDAAPEVKAFLEDTVKYGIEHLPEIKAEIHELAREFEALLPSGSDAKDGIVSFAKGVADALHDLAKFVELLEKAVSLGQEVGLFHSKAEITNEDNVAGAKIAKDRGVGFFDVSEQQRAVADAHAARIEGTEAQKGLTESANGAAEALDGLRGGASDSNPNEFNVPAGKDFYTAKAHASGGIVGPAPGEKFASVAPGEAIIPASQLAATSPLGGGGGDVHNHYSIDMGGITVSGDGKSAQEITAEMLQQVLEQIALTQGLGAPA